MRNKEFIQGAACAIAIINRNHDEPTMCAEALVAIGPSTADALREAGVDEYDIEGLGSALQHLEARRARERRPSQPPETGHPMLCGCDACR